MKQHAKTKKDFEAARLGVFAIPGLLLTHLKRGIQVEKTALAIISGNGIIWRVFNGNGGE